MGLFDFFDKEKSHERKLKKYEKRVTNMFLQAPDRQFTFQDLAQIGSPEAAWILLQRYNENNPNTTLDIEEKQLVFDHLTRMALDPESDVVGQAKRYVLGVEDAQLKMKEFKINWPMKILERLLPEEEYVAFIVEVFESCDTEYQRSVERKQELLLRATELKDKALAHQIARFVGDDNETIRFLAFDAALKQEGDATLNQAVFERILEEESGRIVQKFHAEIAGRHDFIVPEELREAASAWLPNDLGVHRDGYIYKRRR